MPLLLWQRCLRSAPKLALTETEGSGRQERFDADSPARGTALCLTWQGTSLSVLERTLGMAGFLPLRKAGVLYSDSLKQTSWRNEPSSRRLLYFKDIATGSAL